LEVFAGESGVAYAAARSGLLAVAASGQIFFRRLATDKGNHRKKLA